MPERKTSMGTFGSKGRVVAGAAGAAVVGAGVHSALSDGLSQSAAQEAALATYDARQVQKELPAATSKVEPIDSAETRTPARTKREEKYVESSRNTSVDHVEKRKEPAPVIVHQNSSSSDNWLWYNMGRASTQSEGAAPKARAPAPSKDREAGAASVSTEKKTTDLESSFWSVFVWLLVLSVICWAVWLMLNKQKKASAPAPRTYSL